MMTSGMTAMNPVGRMNPTAEAAATNGSEGSQESTISANDFLTLLVTEMKNQDPTAQTDPNEYINQLVQVNSLEQLIQINQNLSTALGVSSPDARAGSQPSHRFAAKGAPSVTSAPAGLTHGVQQANSARGTIVEGAIHDIPAVSGNLSVPKPMPAAQRVAQALSGR